MFHVYSEGKCPEASINIYHLALYKEIDYFKTIILIQNPLKIYTKMH